MADPSVPYTYDSTQGVHYQILNDNFSAITEGLSESTFDLDFANVDASSNVSINGTTTIANNIDVHSLTTLDGIDPHVWGLDTAADSQTVSAGNVCTVEKAFTAVTSAGASEDLETLADNGYFDNGSLLILIGTSGKQITVKDGVDNIYCGADLVIGHQDTMTLMKMRVDGTEKWLMISYSNNS